MQETNFENCAHNLTETYLRRKSFQSRSFLSMWLNKRYDWYDIFLLTFLESMPYFITGPVNNDLSANSNSNKCTDNFSFFVAKNNSYIILSPSSSLWSSSLKLSIHGDIILVRMTEFDIIWKWSPQLSSIYVLAFPVCRRKLTVVDIVVAARQE